mmetsp:Transcript_22128/g.55808  ORF Transcript_22128/g.55808 Transcript_22128/m.55808 type:complete len:208 (-) Transcript_22128:1586-2209(-)
MGSEGSAVRASAPVVEPMRPPSSTCRELETTRELLLLPPPPEFSFAAPLSSELAFHFTISLCSAIIWSRIAICKRSFSPSRSFCWMIKSVMLFTSSSSMFSTSITCILHIRVKNCRSSPLISGSFCSSNCICSSLSRNLSSKSARISTCFSICVINPCSCLRQSRMEEGSISRSTTFRGPSSRRAEGGPCPARPSSFSPTTNWPDGA